MAGSWQDFFRKLMTGSKKPDHEQIESPPPKRGTVAINLGIDFGTSFTKVCFRDSGAEQSGVVHFESVVGQIPIIPSVICVRADGALRMAHHASLAPDEIEVRYLKMRLAGNAIDQHDCIIGDHDLNSETGCKALSAWFLASVLQESKLFVETHENNRLRGRNVLWSANIGVPVEHCDSPKLAIFEAVLRVAWQWNLTNALPKTLSELITAYERDEDARDALPDFHAIPEIAAAVQSFVISREARPDFYAYFDVGGGTVDGVAFKYDKPDGERKVDFYSGKVASLGMAVVSTSAPQLLEGYSTGCPEEARLKLQLQQLVANIVTTAKRKDGRNWQRDAIQTQQRQRPYFVHLRQEDMAPLVFFLGGYGARVAWYETTIQATYNDFHHENAGLPPYEIRRVPNAKDLTMNGVDEADFSRFAIAYGLSIPSGEGPTIALPSNFSSPEGMSGDPSNPNRPSWVVDYLDSKDAYG